MQIVELLQLTNWIEENIKETAVAQKFKTLFTVINQNANIRNNQPQQPFETQKDDVIDTISSINTLGLTSDQEKMLVTMGIFPNIGEDGVNKMEDILFKSGIDIATAASKIQKMQTDIESAIRSSDTIKSSLENLIEDEDVEDEIEQNVLMRVHFQKDVPMDNLSDFKKWGTSWYDIGRGIAMAHGASPNDIKIVGAQKGSIIIELAVIAGIAKTTSMIILSALKVADKVLTIRKKAKELKSLDLNNEKLEKELEAEAKKQKDNGLSNITNEISVKLKLDVGSQGDKIKAIEKSVKNLMNFIENGGEVDFYAEEAEDDETESDIKKIRENFDEIKLLEKKVLALEDKVS